MGCCSTIIVSFLFYLAFQPPEPTGANPVYNALSNTDLMDFKVGLRSGGHPGLLDPCSSPLIFSKSMNMFLSPMFSLDEEFAGPLGGQDAS